MIMKYKERTNNLNLATDNTPPPCSICLERPDSQEAGQVGEGQGGLPAEEEVLAQTPFLFVFSSFPRPISKFLAKTWTRPEKNYDIHLQQRMEVVRLMRRGGRK